MGDVSIHAPVKGATEPLDRPSTRWRVSIHAPVKGATWSSSCALHPLVSIHAPVKGATTSADIEIAIVDVSIHAPVKGATDAEKSMRRCARRFQSTRP